MRRKVGYRHHTAFHPFCGQGDWDPLGLEQVFYEVEESLCSTRYSS